MNLILSSIFSTCKFLMEKKGTHKANKKNSKILVSHVFALHELKLTVIIGSNGPKISSDMIAASSGGSTNMVGSINLRTF